ncbi:MAG: type I-D CRISPR-associated helicase Cas3' [Thermoplasmatales archaeon]
MIVKNYRFPPLYLDLTDQYKLGYNLHEFQLLFSNFREIKEDCLFIDAPTASGKTLSFILPSACNTLTFRRAKTLIISPSNLLIAQTQEDIRSLIEKNPEISDLKASKITGKSISGLTLPERAKIIRTIFMDNDIIISNPDIIALFLSGFYDFRNRDINKVTFTRIRSQVDIFSELDVVIFDEYHVYSEEEIGKILALIYLCRISGNTPKLIFTSATPNAKIKEMLKSLNFSFLDWHVLASDLESPNSRRIKGEINFTLTDQDIMESLTPDITNEDRYLYLFDHKISAEIARGKLVSLGLRSNLIGDLTGFSNRALEKRDGNSEKKCIIATNAAEQGLNLDITVSHIEPGLYLENLSQRYGRIGRGGKSGSITVHFASKLMEKIPDTLKDFSDLLSNLERISLQRNFFLIRVKRHFAAFLSIYYLQDKRGQIGQQIKNWIENVEDPSISKVFNSIINFNKFVIEIKKSNDIHPADANDLSEWWTSFLYSTRFFRGQSINVVVGLEREGQLMKTMENILWIKKWCNYEEVGDGMEKYYLIKSFKQVPSVIELEFKIPQSEMRVKESELYNISTFRSEYIKKVSRFIKDTFEGYSFDIDVVLSSLESALGILYPEMLMPLEVELASESQII